MNIENLKSGDLVIVEATDKSRYYEFRIYKVFDKTIKGVDIQDTRFFIIKLKSEIVERISEGKEKKPFKWPWSKK